MILYKEKMFHQHTSPNFFIFMINTVNFTASFFNGTKSSLQLVQKSHPQAVEFHIHIQVFTSSCIIVNVSELIFFLYFLVKHSFDN